MASCIITPPNSKSRYWKFFGFWGTENGVIIDKEVFVCKICRRAQRYHANTSNLREHLRIHHKDVYKELEENGPVADSFPNTVTVSPKSNPDSGVKGNGSGNNSLIPVPTSNSYLPPDPSNFIASNLTFDVNMLHYDDQNDVLEEANASTLSSFLAEDLVPLNIVEKSGFRRLLLSIDPAFHFPSLQCIRSEIKKMYDVCYNELLSDLHKSSGISLAMEKWSATSNQFVTVTVHFINANWEAESRVLHTQTREDGICDAQYLNNCLEMCHLKKKVLSVTVRSEGMSTDLSQDQVHIPTIECFASFLNRCICEAMYECHALQSIICKFRMLAAHLGSSPINAAFFEKQQIIQNLPCQKLLNDNKSSWMTTHEMMTRAVEQQSAIDCLPKENKMEVTESEWILTRQVVKLLNVAKAASKAMLEQKYPSASTVLPLYHLVIDSMSISTGAESSDLAELKQNLLNKLKDKYNSSVCKDILNIASFCDPRFKTLSHLSEEERKTFLQVIKAKLNALCSPENSSNFDANKDLAPVIKRQRSDMSLMEDLLATFSETQTVEKSSWQPDILCSSEKCEQEIASYLAEERLPLAGDPFEFWRNSESCYPILSKIARKYLCITGSCVPSDCVFSPKSSDPRSNIESDVLDMLLFLHDHFHRKA